MPNNILVGSENIKGDISSCGTTSTIVGCAERPNLFVCVDRGWVTNNCTGQTTELQSWSLSGTSIFLMALIGLLSIIAFFRAIE